MKKRHLSVMPGVLLALLLTGLLIACPGTTDPDPVAVESVSIDGGDTGAIVGTNKTLTATVLPKTATNQTVTWESSDTDIATIDSASGVVTPLAEGTAMITVTTNGVNSGGNSESATIKITVVPGAITGTLSYSDDIETTYGTKVSRTPTFDGAPTTGVKTYSIAPVAGGDMPTGITIDTGTGTVTVGETVDVQTATDYTVSVEVTGFSGIKEATITVTVTSKALVGTLHYTAISVNAGTSGYATPGFGNWVDGQTVSYTISPDDVSGISIDTDSGKVTVGTSAVIADSGTYTVTATATGNFHGTISFNITITVT